MKVLQLVKTFWLKLSVTLVLVAASLLPTFSQTYAQVKPPTPVGRLMVAREYIVDGAAYTLFICQTTGRNPSGTPAGYEFTYAVEQEAIEAIKTEYNSRYPELGTKFFDEMFADRTLSTGDSMFAVVVKEGEILGTFRAAIPKTIDGLTPGEEAFGHEYPRSELPPIEEVIMTGEDGEKYIERRIPRIWELKNFFIRRGSPPAVGALLMEILGETNGLMVDRMGDGGFVNGMRVWVVRYAAKILAVCSEKVQALHIKHGFSVFQKSKRTDKSDVLLVAEPKQIVEKFAGDYLKKVGAKPGSRDWYKAVEKPGMILPSHWRGTLEGAFKAFFGDCRAVDYAARYGTAYPLPQKMGF